MAELLAGHVVPVGLGVSTVLADMDFETYSEAGYRYIQPAPTLKPDRKTGVLKVVQPLPKWVPLVGAAKAGISAVGAAVYASHPSTEVLCLYYDLKDGRGRRPWAPGWSNPSDLFEHLDRGGVIEAHNAAFEYWIWAKVCTRLYGWPTPRVEWFRDSAAKARAWALPGSLADLGKVLNLENMKIAEGKRLIKKFSCPRNPTKNNPATRVRLQDDPADGALMFTYNEGDIITEAEASFRMPDLDPDELAFFLDTFRMNVRGVGIDTAGVENCCTVVTQTLDTYNQRLAKLTGGQVTETSKLAQLKDWAAAQGVHFKSLDSEALEEALARPGLPEPVRTALEYRAASGSASVNKVFAMSRMNLEGRLHDLFVYHRARTGRDGGADVQPQNLPKAGPKVAPCTGCGKIHGTHTVLCSRCGAPLNLADATGWDWTCVDQALEDIATGSAAHVERVYGDALLTVSGCLRGLFCAGPGHDLICSDYSSIEAVVTAMIAGEQWRIEAFRNREDIYYHGASAITGKPYSWYVDYYRETGHKHEDRQYIGKPSELGLGFGGWIGAWRQFDKTDRFSDDEVKRNIVAWREKSPAVVEAWGGQVRGKPWNPDRREYYGLEGMAICAVMNPLTGWWMTCFTVPCRPGGAWRTTSHGSPPPRAGRASSPYPSWAGTLTLRWGLWAGYGLKPTAGGCLKTWSRLLPGTLCATRSGSWKITVIRWCCGCMMN